MWIEGILIEECNILTAVADVEDAVVAAPVFVNHKIDSKCTSS